MTQNRTYFWQAAFGAGLMFLTATPGCKKPHQASAPPAAVPVVATEVIIRNQPIYVESIGQTKGSQDVDIRARIEGFLDTVNFAQGTTVKSNDLLYRIDDKPFRASLAQAEGNLAQAEAAWDKAKRDTNRFGPLWANKAISFQQYDDSLAAERSAAAVLQSAQAMVDNAQIQLSYTTIRAPLGGLVGKNEVSVGNLVGRGASTLLTTMSSIDPIQVRFSISEADYLKFRRRSPSGQQARREAKGIFELTLADGTVYGEKGDVVFADRQVDPTTGTLLMSVEFPNPEGLIRPGQFARVRFPVEIVTNAVLVPQRAVQELQANFSVFVVTPDSKAEYRKIQMGPRVGQFYVVSAGLKPGEKVVIDGVQKLQNNVPVMAVVTNLPGMGPPPQTSTTAGRVAAVPSSTIPAQQTSNR